MASCFTYSLGKSLYIPLTSRCNSNTLPETRGPNFELSTEIVATLCRVRDAENQTEKWESWYSSKLKSYTRQTEPQKMKLPKAQDSVATLEIDDKTNPERGLRYPSVDDLFLEAEQRIETGAFESVVFAGEGEPTLRMTDLVWLATKIRKENHTMPLRLTTNGLFARDNATQILKACGISMVSVALMTHDPGQYDELMKPNLADNDDTTAHEVVCLFIQESIKVGLSVEATGVAREDVSQAATEKLAKALGIEETFRWRPYFP